MVTGPVSIPFIGLVVNDCAYVIQSTVMDVGLVMSPNRIGGFTQRDP